MLQQQKKVLKKEYHNPFFLKL